MAFQHPGVRWQEDHANNWGTLQEIKQEEITQWDQLGKHGSPQDWSLKSTQPNHIIVDSYYLYLTSIHCPFWYALSPTLNPIPLFQEWPHLHLPSPGVISTQVCSVRLWDLSFWPWWLVQKQHANQPDPMRVSSRTFAGTTVCRYVKENLSFYWKPRIRSQYDMHLILLWKST